MTGREISKGQQLFRDVIELLESIPDLQDKIDQDEEDISDLKKELVNRSSLHKVKGPSGPALDDNIRQKQKIRNRERAMLRTKKLLNRVEKALDKTRGDVDFEILEMRYIKGMTVDQIAEELHYSTQTIWRKHKRLIQKLERKLFGADALTFTKGVNKCH